MADYKGSEAYKFELFEPQRAPQQQPKKKAVGPQRVVKQKPKTQAEIRAEIRESNKRIAKIVVVAVVLLALVGSVLLSRAQLMVLALEEEAALTTLSQQKSENVRLQSALAQKMTMEEIENYAVNRLGMVKSSNSQITYIKVTDGDSVIYYEGAEDKPD
ncbi:MAG: hypothetical protein IJF40_06855 [Clostridia bacterium]|nr:hypothetical protein [Clostridia bacterium]MBQ7047212.1 hypothetical protein [Oscillospiraceae bacterium]